MSSSCKRHFRVKITTVFRHGDFMKIPEKFIHFVDEENIVTVKHLIEQIRNRYNFHGSSFKLYLQGYVLQEHDPIQVLKEDDCLTLETWKTKSTRKDDDEESEDQDSPNEFRENHETEVPECSETSTHEHQKKKRKERHKTVTQECPEESTSKHQEKRSKRRHEAVTPECSETSTSKHEEKKRKRRHEAVTPECSETSTSKHKEKKRKRRHEAVTLECLESSTSKDEEKHRKRCPETVTPECLKTSTSKHEEKKGKQRYEAATSECSETSTSKHEEKKRKRRHEAVTSECSESSTSNNEEKNRKRRSETLMSECSEVSTSQRHYGTVQNNEGESASKEICELEYNETKTLPSHRHKKKDRRKVLSEIEELLKDGVKNKEKKRPDETVAEKARNSSFSDSGHMNKRGEKLRRDGDKSIEQMESFNSQDKTIKFFSKKSDDKIVFDGNTECASQGEKKLPGVHDHPSTPYSPQSSVRKESGWDVRSASQEVKRHSILPKESSIFDEVRVSNSSIEYGEQGFNEKKKRRRRRKKKNQSPTENSLPKQTTVYLRNPTLFVPPPQKAGRKKWANSTSKHTHFDNEDDVEELNGVSEGQCRANSSDLNISDVHMENKIKTSTPVSEEQTQSSKHPLLSMLPRSLAIFKKQPVENVKLEKSPSYCRPMPPEFTSPFSQKIHEGKDKEVISPLLSLAAMGNTNLTFQRKMKKNHLLERQKNVSQVYTSPLEAGPRTSSGNNSIMEGNDNVSKEVDQQLVNDTSPERTRFLNDYDYNKFKENVYADMNFQRPVNAETTSHSHAEEGRYESQRSEENRRKTQRNEDHRKSQSSEEPCLVIESKEEDRRDSERKEDRRKNQGSEEPYHDIQSKEEGRCDSQRKEGRRDSENLGESGLKNQVKEECTGENRDNEVTKPSERFVEKETVLPSDMLPSKGWFLSFKMLELNAYGCPEVSEVKTGEVVDVDIASKSVTLHCISKFAKRGKGEELVCVEGLDNNCITLNWGDVIEPRQLLLAD